MAELALDDEQWDAFARHLDGVRMSELVRREPTPHARVAGCSPQL